MVDPSKLTIFLVDDHPIVRDGLRVYINAQPDMEVVGDAPDAIALPARVEASHAQIVLLDISMPGIGGPTATAQLLRALPALKVLALSAHDEHRYVEQMFAAGARGYVVKRAAVDELARAIRAVARGETYLDPAVSGAFVARVVNGRPTGLLSEREEQVLRQMARGASFKEVAASLGVSVRTVETYRTRAMDKADLHSRADIIRMALERGWLAP